MRVYEAFETSDKLTSEGLVCEIEFGGKVIAEVRVRPADISLNPDYRRTLADLAVGVKANGADLDPVEDRERLYKLYARSVILGWKWTDAADRKDAKLRFNEKNACALFMRAPKFFEAIQRAANTWGDFRTAHEEQAAGN